jgi:hypothetical protein
MERVLNPNQDLGKILYGLRALAYWQMINPYKFFVANLTNGVVGGAQQIVTDVGQRAWTYMPKAIWDTTKWYSGKGKLTPDETRMFVDLHDNGVARPQYLDAMGMRLQKDPNTKMLMAKKALSFISWPARTSEIVSRLYTALAAFRAANDGLVNSPRAIDIHGPGISEKISGKMTEEQYQRNMKYASKIVDDSHMIWGELNRPEMVTQSGQLGKAAGSALIFRHYTQGLFHMWRSMWKEGPKGKSAMAESLIAQMLLGGIVGGSILNGFF